MKINKKLKEFESRLAVLEAEKKADDAPWESNLNKQKALLKLSGDIFAAVSRLDSQSSAKHKTKAFELRTRLFGLLEQSISKPDLDNPKALREQLEIIADLEKDFGRQKDLCKEPSSRLSVIKQTQGYLNEKLGHRPTSVMYEQLEAIQNNLMGKHYLCLEATIKQLNKEVKEGGFNNEDLLKAVKELSFELRSLEKKSNISFPKAHELQQILYETSINIESRISETDPELLETAKNVNRISHLNYLYSQLDFLAEKYENILPGKTLTTQYDDNEREISDLIMEILQIKMALPDESKLEEEKITLKNEIEVLKLQLSGLTNISSEERKEKIKNLRDPDPGVRKREEDKQQKKSHEIDSIRQNIAEKEKKLAAIGRALDAVPAIKSTIADIEIKLDKCRQINVLTLMKEPEKSKKVLALFLQYARDNKVESATELTVNTAAAEPMTSICKSYLKECSQEDLWTLLNSDASRMLVLTALRSSWKRPEIKTKGGQIWANVLDKLSSDDKKFQAKLPEVWKNVLMIDKDPQARKESLTKLTQFLNNPELPISEPEKESLIRVAIATLLPTATQDELWLMMKSDIAAKMLLEAYVKNKGSNHPLTQMWDRLINGDGSTEARLKGQQEFTNLLNAAMNVDSELIEKIKQKQAKLMKPIAHEDQKPQGTNEAVTTNSLRGYSSTLSQLSEHEEEEEKVIDVDDVLKAEEASNSDPHMLFELMKQEINKDPDKAGQLFKQILDSDEYKQDDKFKDKVTEYMANHLTLIRVFHESSSTGGVLGITPSVVAIQNTSHAPPEKNDQSSKWKKHLRDFGKTGVRPCTDLPQSAGNMDSKDKKEQPTTSENNQRLSFGRR